MVLEESRALQIGEGRFKMENTRIPVKFWPLIAAASPVLVPVLGLRNIKFEKTRNEVERTNKKRIAEARKLELPELDRFELKSLVEWKTRPGFERSAGVSYVFNTDRGSLLFDIGFGEEQETLAKNAKKLGFSLDDVDAVAISHLHLDHFGGMKASRSKTMSIPASLSKGNGKPCYLPEDAKAPGFDERIVAKPTHLAGGIYSTGPLCRSLFLLGLCEEQSIIAKIKDKGIVLFTGCVHPTIQVILDMVKKLTDDPIYAIGGGLHFPVTTGRGNKGGIQLQMLFGTGKPPWERITENDQGAAIEAINAAAPKRVLLSAHDTCDSALARFDKELDADVEVIEAGGIYDL